MSSAALPTKNTGSNSSLAQKRARGQLSTGSRRPRAVGGFLIESESDDDDVLINDEPPYKRRACLSEIDVPTPEPTENLPWNQADEILDRLMTQREKTPIDLTESSAETFQDAGIFIATRLDLSTRCQGAPITSATTCFGKRVPIRARKRAAPITMEQLAGARSITEAGRATKSYYGIQIYDLIEDAKAEVEKNKSREDNTTILLTIEQPEATTKQQKSLMWTEKYRAMNFFELVGDDRTHRQVLRWLKSWDPIVFPKSGKAKVAPKNQNEPEDPKTHRKILLLTGPPGLGKTTLAHVCAKQAGYEVLEINASDDRSREVVNGRIKTSINTESVKNGSSVTHGSGHVQKRAHPLCVVVDEVDGVFGGSGASEEKGFINALIDLINLDQKNTTNSGSDTSTSKRRKKKATDSFKFQRPLILICNDVYHPSLRQLRQSNFAEIIHVRKASLDAVLVRVRTIFEKEGINCDEDAVRRLCEATWGISATESRRHREGAGEGDLRSILVVGEWAARKLRASSSGGEIRLTRKWVEEHMLSDLSHGGDEARSVGRGEARDIAKRVFLEGAGFPPPTVIAQPSNSIEQARAKPGVAELVKRAGLERLREMTDKLGDTDRVVTDIFYQYPSQPFNDDSSLSKPNAAYEWFHFHDACASQIFSDQAFELAPYLNQPVLACHYLFASPGRHRFEDSGIKKLGGEETVDLPPFTGPRADYEAREAEKLSRAVILALQSSLTPTNLRSFKNLNLIVTEILPYLIRVLTPDIKPVVVGGTAERKAIASVRRGSEKAMVKRAVDIMGDLNITFERGKLESDSGNMTSWVYRMEPPLDNLVFFETADLSSTMPPPVRYAVRQILDQEYQKEIIVRENAARYARYHSGRSRGEVLPQHAASDKKILRTTGQTEVKKDFFGRLLLPQEDSMPNKRKKKEQHCWVTFHEGFSNAVRKPLTVDDLLRGL